ncbi:hypothetical protein [Mucilaginibacter dorajii]|uniref:Uncharacterized protein n=1 Tax=Mucilaginibacter dorajii TaxID=692994 RepID=A0ABP7PZN4_9SPHI|nr:hypothetical protein [Mucilaginibacter dorajii]MCS3732958.1 hypothetical protein [Mucilaginibacter dorajii]
MKVDEVYSVFGAGVGLGKLRGVPQLAASIATIAATNIMLVNFFVMSGMFTA